MSPLSMFANAVNTVQTIAGAYLIWRWMMFTLSGWRQLIPLKVIASIAAVINTLAICCAIWSQS